MRKQLINTGLYAVSFIIGYFGIICIIVKNYNFIIYS